MTLRLHSTPTSSSRLLQRGVKQWAQRHTRDPFVKQAAAQGYRSRAAFKLLQLDSKLRLLRPGMRALELGSAPGSWTQVLAQQQVRTVCCDLLEMPGVANADFVRGDFTAPE